MQPVSHMIIGRYMSPTDTVPSGVLFRHKL